MKVLSISTDRKIFENDSPVQKRIVEYGNMVDELNIIVFNLKNSKLQIPNYKQIQNLKFQIPNTNVWLYPTNSKNKLFYIIDAIRIGKKIIKKDWIITTQDPFETGLAGWFISRKFKNKLQFQIHTDFLSKYFKKESFLNKIRVVVAKFLLPKADGIRVVSERIKQSLLTTHYKLPTISVLPIFVDIKKIENTLSKFDLHQKYPQFSFILLAVSRFEKEKNIFSIINIMEKIVHKNSKIGLVLVGDGSLKQSLQLTAHSLQLRDNIIFEGWKNDLISYYKTADLFISASNYEGYGMSLIEAASSGCPILTSDVGVVGEILNNKNSLICDVGDIKCFVENILKASNDKTSLYNMMVKARNNVEKNIIKNKKDYLNKYKESLELIHSK